MPEIENLVVRYSRIEFRNS